MSRTVRVADLAVEAGLELDEVLVALWDAGVDSVDGEMSVVPARSVATARQALGLPLAKQLSSTSYWQEVLGLGEREWLELLSRLQIQVSGRARTLPKGAPAKLKRHAREIEKSVVSNRAKPELAPVLEPVTWRTIGRARQMDCLTAEEVDAIHGVLVEEFAGTEDPFGDPCGVREWDLLA